MFGLIDDIQSYRKEIAELKASLKRIRELAQGMPHEPGCAYWYVYAHNLQHLPCTCRRSKFLAEAGGRE